ncbi:MAG: hypothetical protein H5T68_07705 [Chloroflexi bacterium]|nr:hypothetical protein [Chloroflexota bacterium]
MSIRARLSKLQRGASRPPCLLQWQDEGMSDAQAEAELVARMRAAGWDGAPEAYPGRAIVVRWLRDNEPYA